MMAPHLFCMWLCAFKKRATSFCFSWVSSSVLLSLGLLLLIGHFRHEDLSVALKCASVTLSSHLRPPPKDRACEIKPLTMCACAAVLWAHSTAFRDELTVAPVHTPPSSDEPWSRDGAFPRAVWFWLRPTVLAHHDRPLSRLQSAPPKACSWAGQGFSGALALRGRCPVHRAQFLSRYLFWPLLSPCC